MRKLAMIVACLMVVAALAGCSNNTPSTSANNQSSAAPEPPPASSAPAQSTPPPTPPPAPEPEPEPENLLPVADDVRSILDKICDEMTAENYEQALELLVANSEEMKEMLLEFPGKDSETKEIPDEPNWHGFIYKDMFEVYYAVEWDYFLISMNNVRNGSGKFAAIDYYNDIKAYDTQEYQNNVPHGKHFASSVSPSYSFSVSAQVVNGLFHGELVNWQSTRGTMDFNYVDGLLQRINAPNDANGLIPITIVRETGEIQYAVLGGNTHRWLTEPRTQPNSVEDFIKNLELYESFT